MSYITKINYLKSKLKNDKSLTEYQVYSIKEEIESLERIEQKQNLQNVLHRKYRKLIDDNNTSVDKKRDLSNSIVNTKNNSGNLEEHLLGNFGDNVIENLKIYDKELKMFENNLKDFEKSINM
ncbi:hypothetical protein LZ906_016610 (plasmid) [Paraclostridium ghonii]|uniref:hypothetical protein n=1 Tax=Paraclostridium ghonii TaxID=29358 RepID=UPI00202CE1C5|nr:hypothetical protein [Paeniclostridium ghonii]MCM0166612.1 hypothetical protein [Paeniclostridium ghonii]